jgi:rhomboid protease GluP
MDSVVVQKKDEIVMRLIHYFITEKNYIPIVVRGVQDEVWLENDEGPYRIIRINSNYIHNEEQFNLDIFKTKNVMRQIKRKTLSLKMNALNIFLNINDDVKLKEVKNIDSIVVNNVLDITKNELVNIFPDIKDKLIQDEEGIELIINVTNDINKKTAKENKIYENIFKPKKVIITNIIIALCIIVFAATVLYGGNILGINSLILYLFGANYKDAVVNGQIYRLITSAFLHVSIFHLIFNIYALFVIGNQLESYIGKFKFLIIYLVSAICGSLMSCIFNQSISVGASGAIFGLLGSLLYFGYHFRIYLESVLKTQIIPLIILNLLIGFLDSSIDNAAHIGGLIGGYLITMALGIKNKSSKSDRINGTIAFIIYILFLIYVLFFR